MQGTGRPCSPSPGERWSHVIVPMIFLAFVLPGLAYGWLTGQIKASRMWWTRSTTASAASCPCLPSSFLAQFVEGFKYSNLDRMLAYSGGSLLVAATCPCRAHRRVRPAGGCGRLHHERHARQVRCHGPDLRPDVHDGRDQPGAHHRGVPHRRFGGERHHAAQSATCSSSSVS